VVTLLEDAISDRRGLLRDGEALAESLSEGLQKGARELTDGAVQRADRGRIEGEQPRILLGCRGGSLSRGLCWCRSPCLVLRSRLGLRSTLVRFEAAPFSFPEPQLPPSTWLSATGVLLSLPAPPPLLPPPNPTLVAVGRGFGHGVGMSQWGALAMAQRGSSFKEILRHYYRGAQLRPYVDIAPPRLAADAGAASGSSPWSPRHAALSSARP
jgi:hypothetical protein